MEAVKLHPIYKELADQLVNLTSPEKILALQPSEEAQERADELLEKNSEGELTVKEQAELEQMLTAHRFMSLLKATALEQLKHT